MTWPIVIKSLFRNHKRLGHGDHIDCFHDHGNHDDHNDQEDYDDYQNHDIAEKP